MRGGNTAENGQVVQYDCHTGDNQRFRMLAHTQGTFRIQAVHSGKCIGVPSGNNTDGARVVQATCTDQVFRVR